MEFVSYRLNQMIMWDLWKKMVYNVGSNIMVNVIEPSIITIYRGKSSPQVTPFLNLLMVFFFFLVSMQFEKRQKGKR